MHLPGVLLVSPSIRKKCPVHLPGGHVAPSSLDGAVYFLFPTLSMSSVELYTAGKVGWESLCPLGKVLDLTFKILIYLLNLHFIALIHFTYWTNVK